MNVPNLFPVANGGMPPGTDETSAGSVRFGRSWRFDYETGDFAVTPTGKIVGCSDKDAWLEWCKKAIRTERYTYLIYSRNYGHEYDELIARNLPRKAIELELIRITTETLKTDPRTGSVGNFAFSWEDDRCYFSCEVTSVRGEQATIGGSVVTV